MLGILLAVLLSAPPQPSWVIPELSVAPALDGAMEEVWGEALQVTDFTTPDSDAAPTKPMEARAGLFRDELWLIVHCAEPNPAALKLQARPGSLDVWQDDCVELFLRAGGDRLGYDQLIVNAAGVTQTVRQSRLAGRAAPLAWSAATKVGADFWMAEIRVGLADLGLADPRPGDLLELKIGREDHTAAFTALSTWPPGSAYSGPDEYAICYLRRDNLLANPDGAVLRDGALANWSYSQEGKDAGLFTSVAADGQRVIRIDSPGRYCTMQQSVNLRPNRMYELSMRVRGVAPLYCRSRVTLTQGGASTPHDVTYRPGADPLAWQTLNVKFPTAADPRALIIIGAADGWPPGISEIADLRLRETTSSAASGSGIRIPAAPTRVKRLLVSDCRLSRGFCGNPVDGTTASHGWNAGVWEYGNGGAGAGVGYEWGDNEGVHITLGEPGGFDAMLIRGGVKAKLYGDGAGFDQPAGAPLRFEFAGGTRRSRATFDQRVTDRVVSFFGIDEGLLADVQFFRVEPLGVVSAGTPLAFGAAPAELQAWLERKYEADSRALLPAAGNRPLPADKAVHLFSGHLAGETGLRAIRLTCRTLSGPAMLPVTVTIHDPIDPKLELFEADLELPGTTDVLLDFPDQLIPAAGRLWITLRAEADAELGEPSLALISGSRADVTPEALAYRKLLLRSFFTAASESRQWMTIRPATDLAEWRKANQWGEQVMQVFDAVDHCVELAPDDPLVKQYDDWLNQSRDRRPTPERLPVLPPLDGAPEWAVVVREAWLGARGVAWWWLDHRLAPNGELGGLVGDDSDLYQNWADLPRFESDGVGGQVLDAGEKLMRLALETTIQAGLNRRTMDPLHAYEEGINQLTLMTNWFYGDPEWLELARLNAKNTAALTVLKSNGRRFFKSQELGAEDLRIDRKTDSDGHSHPLMWHPSLELAWYNHDPAALRPMDEWADAWLAHQQPGAYATSIQVADEKVTASERDALRGGYGSQAGTFVSLYQITGDAKYLGPFLEEWRTKGNSRIGLENLAEFGELIDPAMLGDKAGEKLASDPVMAWRTSGDKAPLLEALKRDIAELQRYPDMYTTAEPFTDRIFLYPLEHASYAYLGGMWTRNRYARDHAVSWSGFGTDYAALVAANRPDRLRVLLYNFADQPRTGAARFWRLKHGRYRLTLGPDADGDDRADSTPRDETIEIVRGAPVSLTLPPRTAMVLALELVEELGDLTARPDLAISDGTVVWEAGQATVKVYNLGRGDAPATSLAVMDRDGKVLRTVPVPALPASRNLEPSRAEVHAEAPAGTRLVIDPSDQIAEVFEGNNVWSAAP